jgi:heme exporter protein CcmD
MGEYALHVWGSYLLAVLVMGGEVLLLRRRRARQRRQFDEKRVRA